ncbi:unnamed protein product [Rotaria sordida]|uniref:FLYWCH-type domain-containing protein n=1 Tax=Rotaria sordida TaxID=392033 RepID=A0A815UKM4_9BILA|nr:unnamed protein product [Rotaria sordida]CAF1520747.1 unnamed protein product [Rotaria sordida]CAF3928370.1 unnamed protein product [Rotaria sordida]CAF4142287.1 unnamed protein product [Rotaria sordida]
MMEIVKGKLIFEHQGYRYIISNESSNKLIYCCCSYRHSPCRGRLHTINDDIVQTLGTHNYELDDSAGEEIIATAKMNDAAKQTDHKTHQFMLDF